jgi:N-methylhydantoinase A
MASTTIDIDTGGTFTDAFVVHESAPRTVKVPTTPHDLAVCFQEVIARAADELGLTVPELLAATASVRYSSTVGTNAVIQRTGPRIGLLVGAGREGDAAGPFVDQDMIAVAGGDDALLVRSTKHLLDRSARGLVCSLPGGDAAAERAVRDGFERHYPKHCLDAVPLLLSHEIDDDPDDARRTATALFNAYVHPDVARYLYRCEDWLRDHGYQHPLLILHNDRGCARVAKTIAGKTYNSGPTAGLLGAEVIAGLYDLPSLLTFDVGGTSLDVAFLADGTAPLREHGVVEGIELSFAMPDLHVLGAGGGSIAHLQDGELRVGPQSAGARPGPACFAMGGTEPTVTDADVVLGILDPDRFLGGSMKLDSGRAEQALRTLGEDAREVADHVRATLHDNMGERIARELQGRGVDPAQMTMLAFGGAGPTHACGVAERIGVRDVITLPFSAVFSAFGAQTTDVTHEYTATPGEGVEERLRARALRDMRGEGFSAHDVEVTASAVTRHGAPRTAVRAAARLRHHGFERYHAGAGAGEEIGRRPVRWPGHGDLETPIYDLDVLAPGAALSGPGVIEAADTTIVVPPGWEFRIDEYGNGRISRR